MDQPITLTPEPEPRRLALVKMSTEFLADLCRQDAPDTWRSQWRVSFGVPESARLIGFFLDHQAEQLVLRFEDDSFPLVRHGAQVPPLEVLLESCR